MFVHICNMGTMLAYMSYVCSAPGPEEPSIKDRRCNHGKRRKTWASLRTTEGGQSLTLAIRREGL